MGKRDKSRSAQRSESPAIDKSQNQRPESSGSDEIYEVECIVAHRIRNGKTEFKVRWFGWSEEYDEWCDPSRMDCPDAIKDYWDRVANRSGVKQQRMDITSSDSDTSPSKQHASSSSKSKRKSEMDTEQLHQISEDAVVDSPNMNENTSGATTYRTSDKNDILKKHTSKKKERRIERVDRSPLSEKSDVVPYVADTSNSATVSSIPVDDDMSGNRCSASVRSSEHQVTSAAITSSVNGHEKAEDVDVDVGASVSSTTCEAKKVEISLRLTLLYIFIFVCPSLKSSSSSRNLRSHLSGHMVSKEV
ncbi:Chromobox protein 1 [Parelaphostrongylus tenuis]|uniref:Chromobox protein 1 n=1 Tax=Parelaphostrongylus tenuis TaxID=148309 RepID=A0AAD5QPA3_PARTN|nr:Chromobox protein 1 [Parelaphostrongylus tenuis]